MRINWLGVLISAIVIVVLRYLWFAHFGGADWAATPGKALADVQANTTAAGMELARAAIVAVGLGWAVGRSKDRSLPTGLVVGLFTALFFAVTTIADAFIQGAPVQTLAINGGYYLAAYALSGAILGALAPKAKPRPAFNFAAEPAASHDSHGGHGGHHDAHAPAHH